MFLEIYAEIIERVKNDRPVGPYTVAYLAEKLCMSIPTASDDGTLFDVTIQHFHALKDKCLNLIQSHVKKELFEEFRQYTNLYEPTHLGLT